MGNVNSTVVTIVLACIASTGFWSVVNTLITRYFNKKDPQAKMLLGLGHDRICELGDKYLERGWISQDEYENLHDYLYVPYTELKGNGSAKRTMEQVKKLPIRKPVRVYEEQ